jgi:hypothetical protein
MEVKMTSMARLLLLILGLKAPKMAEFQTSEVAVKRTPVIVEP